MVELGPSEVESAAHTDDRDPAFFCQAKDGSGIDPQMRGGRSSPRDQIDIRIQTGNPP